MTPPKTRDEPIDPALPEGVLVPPGAPEPEGPPVAPPLPVPNDDVSRVVRGDRGNRGPADLRRAVMAWYSVDGAMGDHCAEAEQPCPICTALLDLRLALEAETGERMA